MAGLRPPSKRANAITAMQMLWARLIVASAIRKARAVTCSHDGTGKVCYGCALMLGFGGFLPQFTLDEVGT
jgi:hypothetical protein